MDNENDLAPEAAQACMELSEKLDAAESRLTAVIMRTKKEWQGAAGDEFAAQLNEIYEMAAYARQRLLILSTNIGMTPRGS